MKENAKSHSKRAERNPLWRGHRAGDSAKRARAHRLYNLEFCELCGEIATDRHHVDGDPGNNSRANIKILCRRCHMKEDGRLEALVEAGQIWRETVACRTHCSRGHEFTEANTYWHQGRHKRCRECRRQADRAAT